ncbi:unnamed protein product [Brassica oleracea]
MFRIFESNQHPHVFAFVDQGSDYYPDEDMPGAVRKSHQPTPTLKKSFPDNTTCRDDDPAIGETLVDRSAQPSQTDAIGSFDDETSVSKKVPISKNAQGMYFFFLHIFDTWLTLNE